jgi:flagellar motor switch protein FliM
MMEAEPILSKEELAAILAEEHADAVDRRPIAAAQRTNPFSRSLTIFAEEQSRLASTIHQRPIRFSLLRVESIPVAAFAASLGEWDRVFTLRIAASAGTGVVALGRSVLFGWLAMAFGAPPSLDLPIPSRGYTRVEIRLLRRLAEELVRQLSKSMQESLPGACEIAELLEPDMLSGLASPRLLAAAFDVEGLGEPGRLRLAFPETWIPDADQSMANQPIEGRVDPESLMNVPLELRAEAGVIEMALHEVGRLRPGDLIPFDGHPGGKIIVRVAGKPRFKAVPGSAGSQAAIQIVSE